MPGKKLKITMIILLVVTVLLVAFVALTAYLAGGDGIYPDINVGEINVGKMSVKEATEALGEKYNTENLAQTFTVTVDDTEEVIDVNGLDAYYDVTALAQTAYSYGRSGSFITRLCDLYRAHFGKIDIEVSLTLDENKIKDVVEDIAKRVDLGRKEDRIEYGEDSFVFLRGNSGQKLDVEKSVLAIKEALAAGDDEITLAPDPISPNEVSVEAVRALLSDVAVEPAFEKVDGEIVVRDGKPAVTVSDDEIKEAIKKAEGIGAVEIKAVIEPPSMSNDEIREKLFADTLGKYTSRYNPGEVNRTSNVHLAAKKISGTVLMPGESFSYNNVVGPREAEYGFKMAKVYTGDTIEDGMGGGICQVSSTLYNSVLLADLKVTERHNHSLTVDYVPLGTDATVAYGFLDFKFANNTNYPVKVESVYGGGSLTISIIGTKEDVSKKVEITTKQLGTVGYATEIKHDDTLRPGTVKIENHGSVGAVVETYKTVYVDGVVISSVNLGTSTYQGQKRIEIHGPELPETTQTPAPPEVTNVPTVEATPIPVPSTDAPEIIIPVPAPVTQEPVVQ